MGDGGGGNGMPGVDAKTSGTEGDVVLDDHPGCGGINAVDAGAETLGEVADVVNEVAEEETLIGIGGHIDAGASIGVALGVDVVDIVEEETVVGPPADDAGVGGVGDFKADDIDEAAADVNAEELTLGVDFGGPTGVGDDGDTLACCAGDVDLDGFVVGAGQHAEHVPGP